MRRPGRNRIHAQLDGQSGDLASMSDHEPARDMEFLGDFTHSQPFIQSAKNDPIHWFHPICQQAEEVVRVDFGHNALVEFERVRPVVPSIGSAGKCCLHPAVSGRIQASSGGPEVEEMKFNPLQVPTGPLSRALPLF